MDPAEATDLYTKQCSLNVSARDLAVMGATLADGGVNPLTKERVVDPIICHYALAVMATAGLYETSGDWLYDIGLPGKSGIGGGIVTVSPGKGGLGTFAPPLDAGRQQRQGAARRQSSCPSGWAWTCSSRNPRPDPVRSPRQAGGINDAMASYDAAASAETRESWVPMIAIALGQAIMSFNVASLPVSIGGMVQSFGVPPTTVGTGIVMYSLAVAGFVMLGAKLVQRFGATRVFRVVVALFAVAQVLMTFSPVATVMLAAQGLAGLAAAVIVPALVALIANHYHGQQQATAVGAWARRAPPPASRRS